jgi:hypothetical protein
MFSLAHNNTNVPFYLYVKLPKLRVYQDRNWSSFAMIEMMTLPTSANELNTEALFIGVNWNRAIITLMFWKYVITIQLTTPVPL